jgi:ornithine carbamoyltransferase
MQHLISLQEWSRKQIADVLDLAVSMKATPNAFERHMHRKVLVMIFEKPSLRTRVSFETGMCQMGGDAIYYDTSTSPMGSGKETIHDSIKALSRYTDLIMARLFDHAHMEEMARYADIPVINGLTNFNHPCQILSDLFTIKEKKKSFQNCTLAYLGDANNNVTHSLLYGCSKMGIHIRVGCPEATEAQPVPAVLAAAQVNAKQTGATVTVTHDAAAAIKDADVVYTDSWMSYHIPKDALAERVKLFTPFQVTADLMTQAAPEAIFMNCLPAMRGYEQTADVIDGPQSVVFDQAENRLHVQKAIMVTLLEQKAET